MIANLDSTVLDGKVALVTGGGRGIGRTIAEKLAAAGASVAIAARSENDVQETAFKIQKRGGTALPIPFDVANPTLVGEAVMTVEQELGPPEILVNNAGVFGPIGPLWETNPEEWWETMTINIYGALLCARSVLPSMVERGCGRIINVASSVATRARPFASAYSTSKAALVHLTECLAAETKDRGVAVFAIHPGTVLTDMTRQIIETETGQKWLMNTRKTFDEGRDLPPERAADLVLYLASGHADALTGRFLSINDNLEAMLRQALGR